MGAGRSGYRPINKSLIHVLVPKTWGYEQQLRLWGWQPCNCKDLAQTASKMASAPNGTLRDEHHQGAFLFTSYNYTTYAGAQMETWLFCFMPRDHLLETPRNGDCTGRQSRFHDAL